MKKQIAVIVLVLISTLSFASGGNKFYSLNDKNEVKPVIYKSNGVALEPRILLLEQETKGTLSHTNKIFSKSPDHQGGNSWISKTFKAFGGGLDLVGFTVKMNRFDLGNKQEWANLKEFNLNANFARNGLSLKYRF